MKGPTKTFHFGNAKVIVNSPLALMSKEERKQFFIEEWEKGNPVLKEIAEAAYDCLESIGRTELKNKEKLNSSRYGKRYSDEDIIKSLSLFLKEHKGKSKYYYIKMKFLPSITTIERRLGSWENAIRLAKDYSEGEK